ncbi:CatB-related O-acetyltransferase [Sulfurimonas indica]|uniref:CatB-related O-acetyltransferase n=1 Tax=Sulfurimonas indica TaxID=2508707 RepID=UPI0012658B2C|nr:CatB-related O-acetyltransferase [Sulfurimonas indica]
MFFTKIINKLVSQILKKKNISFRADLDDNVVIGEMTTIDMHTRIKAYTYIGRNCNITKSQIGRYCSIANNVSIGQGEHDLTKISTSSLFYDNAYDMLTIKECVIENDVWIGTDSVILRGVKVGNGAVIGANSVVTKDIPPYAIAVGSPARVIRYRFPEDKIQQLIKSKWWQLNLGEAKVKIKELEKC